MKRETKHDIINIILLLVTMAILGWLTFSMGKDYGTKTVMVVPVCSASYDI